MDDDFQAVHGALFWRNLKKWELKCIAHTAAILGKRVLGLIFCIRYNDKLVKSIHFSNWLRYNPEEYGYY